MSEPNVWIYVLAAKGIQEYILAGDRLRLMVGASEIIEELPETILRCAAEVFHWRERVDFKVLFAAAGGIRLLFNEKTKAETLIKYIPLAVNRHAPGLGFVQVAVEVKENLADAMCRSETQLQMRRNLLFPAIPVPGPLVARVPRSGKPVAGELYLGKDREPADRAMLAKDRKRGDAKQSMAEKVLPDCARGGEGKPRLPEDIEDLASGENSNIAIFHADGNGLGALVMRLMEELKRKADQDEILRIYRSFSNAVAKATKEAIKEAMEPIAQKAMAEQSKFWPFRPLVCAGDDVTILLRAANALAFADKFLEAFEKTSRNELAELKALTGVDVGVERLTACAGIAYVKKNYPFAQAYALSESLAAYAKDATQRQCSAVAFWRLTAHQAGDFSVILQNELTVTGRLPAAGVTLTLMPYSAGAPHGGRATIAQLTSLKDAVRCMPRGSLRVLLATMYHGKDATDREFRRIKEVATGRGGDAAASWRQLQDRLAAITGNGNVLWKSDATDASTPLHDAIELLAAERE